MLQAPGLQPQSRSILAPQASGPQPLSLAFQLQQQVYISICPTINLIDSSETKLQLIELLFYNSRLEKTLEARHEHPVFGNEDRVVHKFKEVVQAMH